jgi:hypothetical protein
MTDLDHWNGVDRAPRVVTRAPDGDFAFATWAKVTRSVFTPWAEGFAWNKTMRGVEHDAPVADLVIPADSAWKRTAPPDNTYKMAFIILARDARDVTDEMVRTVDRIRIYLQDGFRLATGNRRLADTTL